MANKSFSFICILGFFILSTGIAVAGKSCHCRATDGVKIEVGGFTCLKTHSGLKEAQCDYVLNNTAWKLTGNACPSAWLLKNQPNINVAVLDFKQIRK